MSTVTAAGFAALHHGRTAGSPLVLPGPWDAATASVFVEAGFEALATPSMGIAAALGHADGSTPADEMFAAVARIVRAAGGAVPVTADLEGGYGLPAAELVERTLATGVVGCNLEDSEGGRPADPGEHSERLAAVVAEAGGRIFINARIDSYLLGTGDPLADALERGRRYVAAGADCVYPIKAPPQDIAVLAGELGVPVNALCGAGSRDMPPAALSEAGASRITFGGGLAARSLAGVRDLAQELRTRI